MPVQSGATRLYFRSKFKYVMGFLFGIVFTASAACQAAIKPDISLSYGQDAAQMLDLYLPASPKQAPILMMVTGQDWRKLNRDTAASLKKKLDYWLPKGFIYIELNYRLLPEASPLQQAAELATAISYVQKRIGLWGGDSQRLALIGAESGAHLLALLSANPKGYGELLPWRASLLLDAPLLDLPALMNAKHDRLLDQVFAQASDWLAASPQHQLNPAAVPSLAVCSSRSDHSCARAQAYAAQAQTLGAKVQVLQSNESARKLSSLIGRDMDYSDQLRQFLLEQLQ